MLYSVGSQDDVNVPGCPIALGFTLQQLSAHTIDEAGKEVFVHKNALEMLRKVRRFRLSTSFACWNDRIYSRAETR